MRKGDMREEGPNGSCPYVVTRICDGPPPLELYTPADIRRIRRMMEKIIREDWAAEAEERERRERGENGTPPHQTS